MRARPNLVRGWLRKAASDGVALDAALAAGAFDAACFHAQQAVEKYLKAVLIFMEVEFPFTHNLVRLVELVAGHDPSFRSLLPTVEPLTPYAVEARYDLDFWPTSETAQDARSAVATVRTFVLSRLSPELGSEVS